MLQKFLLLAFFTTGFPPSITAFVASRPQHQVSLKDSSTTAIFSKTRLQYREHDDFLDYESTQSIKNSQQITPLFPRQLQESKEVTRNAQQATFAFLPRQSQELAHQEKFENLLDAEISICRLAMVASITLLGTEVMSGTSILDQFSGLFGS